MFWEKICTDSKRIKSQNDSLSWRNTQLTNLQRVSAWDEDGNWSVEIGENETGVQGASEFWYSCTYESVFPGNGSRLVAVRVERRFCETDYNWGEFNGSNGHKVVLLNIPCCYHRVLPEDKGKWLIVEYNLLKNEHRIYIKDGKI